MALITIYSNVHSALPLVKLVLCYWVLDIQFHNILELLNTSVRPPNHTKSRKYKYYGIIISLTTQNMQCEIMDGVVAQNLNVLIGKTWLEKSNTTRLPHVLKEEFSMLYGNLWNSSLRWWKIQVLSSSQHFSALVIFSQSCDFYTISIRLTT